MSKEFDVHYGAEEIKTVDSGIEAIETVLTGEDVHAIVKTDYYGSIFYDAEWKPNDENFGTTLPYWYALMEPVHGRRNKP